MKDRLKEDMDKIKLNPKLKEDTIRLMREALNKEEKSSLPIKRKFLITVIGFALAIALILGMPNIRPSAPGNNNSPLINIATAENLMERIEGEKVKDIDIFPEDFLNKTTEFSVDMFKTLAGEENAVYSPTPLYLSLGLILNGANDEAKAEILKALSNEGITEEELNLYYKGLIKEFTRNTGDTVLNINNSIWYDDYFKANVKFLEDNKTYYNADAYKIDFSSSVAHNAINDWVKEVTNGKIQKMVDEVSKDTVMYLFSSIYFNGKWETPFDKKNTFSGEFYLNNNTTTDVKFMSKNLLVQNMYNEGEEEGILLPYNDGKYALMALMPDDGIDIRYYVSTLSADKIKEKMEKMGESRVQVYFPKFEINYETKLINSIKALGITRIFDERGNSLVNMGEGSGNLFISDMLQKTYIKVDESGTEAASAVGTEITLTSMPPTINFNRPFVYFIMDTSTGLPLFIGIMDNPNL